MDSNFDVVIVGGGIAGMTAAIYVARANLTTIILEKGICGGLASWTHTVDNFPSYQSIHGMDLMQKIKDHVESLNVGIEEIAEVNHLELDILDKIIKTGESTYRGKSIILATGRVPIPLPLETDWEDHTHYCSICDGSLYKGKELVVVGGGNSGFDESLYLLSLGVKSIVLVEEMDTCNADETTQEKALATKKITCRTNTRVSAICQQEGKGNITLENTKTGSMEKIMADGIFVFIGQSPNTKILEEKVKLDNFGYIITDAFMHTNIPGVFAAGDVIVKRYRQLTTAMSDGTIAALEAIKYVREKYDGSDL